MKYKIFSLVAIFGLAVSASDFADDAADSVDEDSFADFVAYRRGLDESFRELGNREPDFFNAMNDRELEEWIRKHDKPVWNYPYDSVVVNGNNITIDGRNYQFEYVDGEIRFKNGQKQSSPDFLWQTSSSGPATFTAPEASPHIDPKIVYQLYVNTLDEGPVDDEQN